MKLWLNLSEEILQECKDFRSAVTIHICAHVLLLIVLKVSLVSNVFILIFPDFLNLIVVNVELFPIK